MSGRINRQSAFMGSTVCVIFFASHAAFSGEFCEEDRNGCSEIQCFEGVECMDVPAPGFGVVCGPCPEGYTGGETRCYGELKKRVKISDSVLATNIVL